MQFSAGKVYCLFDSGCELTVLPADLVDKRDLQPTEQRLSAANNTSIPLLGKATVTASVGSHEFQIDGLVSEHVQEPMLGIAWLKQNKVNWDFETGNVRIRGCHYRLKARPGQNVRARRVKLAEIWQVPAYSECDVPADVVIHG